MIFSEEEIRLFETIEHQRTIMIDSNRGLKYRDFGAGNPNEERTVDTMYNGVEVESSTAKNCQIGLKGEWAQWIYSKVKKYQPQTILELGTNCGFSSIYMAKANKYSTVHTIEGAEAIADIARENFNALGCDNIIQHLGRFQDVLENVLTTIKRVDFAFIDGHHDYQATLDYFEQIKPFLSEHAVIVFDDISWSEGMRQAWREILADSKLKKFEDLTKLGVIYL